MTLKLAILSIFLTLSSFGLAQENPLFTEFAEKNYAGGFRGFLEDVYHEIKYPAEARSNCGIGQLRMTITISPENGLEKINFLNPFGYGVQKDVIRTLSLFKQSWKPKTRETSPEIIFAYRLEEFPTFEGDINITGYSVNQSYRNSGCLSSERLIKKLEKYLAKSKLSLAQEIYLELIRRGCRSEAFLQIQKKFEDRLEVLK